MFRALSVVLLLLSAGCVADGGGGPSVQATTDGPPDSTTRAAGEHPSTDTARNATVEYGDLSPAERRAFDTALGGEANFVHRSSLDSLENREGYFTRDVAEPFRAHEYVRKSGELYRLDYEASGGDLLASYGVHAELVEPPANATVVPVGNLPSDAQGPVREAVRNGSYHSQTGEGVSRPEGLGEGMYVESDGEVYRLTYSVGDLWPDVLRVERVD
ncbi:hypothetical protein ACFO0N_00625 [Halobium salinum]|uniref:DUF7979 domain-containing protein n=1 Tax=Halobium salinum TaxID=1364940 RepID=A0ABD5P6U6_9EURY|nr:hypothetical protein [Halobium salinum]